jgi:hypothetical protein
MESQSSPLARRYCITRRPSSVKPDLRYSHILAPPRRAGAKVLIRQRPGLSGSVPGRLPPDGAGAWAPYCARGGWYVAVS